MNDQPRSDQYQALLAYLEARGQSLAIYGSAERGLNMDDTREFLGLLRSCEVAVLGIEVWREKDSWYTLNGLEVWYPHDEGPEDPHADALKYLSSIAVGSHDFLTVQFR